MLLDILVIVILLIAVITGRKSGLFRTVARFLSLITAGIFTSLWGEKLCSFIASSKLYEEMLLKLTESVEKAVTNGKTEILSPFLREAGVLSATETAAQSMLDTFLSVCIFVLFVLLVRILIEVLDKVIFHLPLLRPLNRFLGMLFSFVFTLTILYLILGVVGGLAVFSDAGFWAEQMQSSVLVRAMYDNNIVLKLISGKG